MHSYTYDPSSYYNFAMDGESFTKEDLMTALAQAHQEIQRLEAQQNDVQWLEGALRKRTRELDERVKELECLHDIAGILRETGSLTPEFFRRTAERLPGAFEHAHLAGVRIQIGQDQYRSTVYAPGLPHVRVDIPNSRGGHIEAAYRSSRAVQFLPEEKIMLETLAAWLGAILKESHRSGVVSDT